MELKTQTLDRLLEAISPVLAAEIDRIIDDLQQELELESRERLQAALREAESSAEVAGRAHLEQSIAEARAEARTEITKQVSEKLEQDFKRILEERTAQLKSEAAAEEARLREQVEHWRVLAQAQQQLAQAVSQAEILARLLRLAEPFATGLAIYVAKDDGFSLWKSRGTANFPETVSEDEKDSSRYFKLISVRGKKVAVVCAAPPYKIETLEFLISSMEVALEIFGLRLRASNAKPATASEGADNDAARSARSLP